MASRIARPLHSARRDCCLCSAGSRVSNGHRIPRDLIEEAITLEARNLAVSSFSDLDNRLRMAEGLLQEAGKLRPPVTGQCHDHDNSEDRATAGWYNLKL